MGWFRRSPSVEEVLEKAVGRIYESQARQIEAVSGLLEKMADLSMKRAASALGSRGGQKRAKNKALADAAKAAASSRCRLCVNPALTNPTVQEILEHNAHEQNLVAPRPEASERLES